MDVFYILMLVLWNFRRRLELEFDNLCGGNFLYVGDDDVCVLEWELFVEIFVFFDFFCVISFVGLVWYWLVYLGDDVF